MTDAAPMQPEGLSQDPEGERVWQYFTGHPSALPTLRGHSARVLAMAGQIMTVDIAELLLLTRADPVSVAEVLRVANGPLLFRGSPVTALDEAIIRLGRREVYSVLTTVAARSLFRPQNQRLLQLMPEAFERVQRRAVVTALCSAWLCHGLRVADYEEAFMLGLFGRIGHLGALYALGNLALAQSMPLHGDLLRFAQERPELMVRMGQHMLRGFGLGEKLVAQCTAFGAPGALPPRSERLLHAVRLVEGLMDAAADADGANDAAKIESAVQACRESLGLAETQLPAILHHLEGVEAQVGPLLRAP